jgi:MFS family permease
VMAGLVLVRVDGPGSVWAWLLMLLGVLVLVPFVRHERGVTDPIVDVDLLASPNQWPIQLTAFLFGIPVLGGQIPLSTFAQADPDVRGYGLGADSSFVSTLIGVYVITVAIGAFTLPVTTRLLGVRRTLIVACLMVAGGYALWLPFHDTTLQALTNLAIAGIGTGALVASLPAAAAAAAPPERTGIATGMTNGTKVIGGAIASSIFAIALASTGSIDKLGEESTNAPLSGYLVVWGVCSGAALLAAIALMLAPKVAFAEHVDDVQA